MSIFVHFRCDVQDHKLCISAALSKRILSSDMVIPESSSVTANCGRLVFPGHIMKAGNELSESPRRQQKLPRAQTLVNSSSEIRSRRRLVPLQRGASDSHADDQLELVDLDGSPVTSHGHRFVSANLNQPTWCDKCGDFIWGVYKRCLICTSMLNMFFCFIVLMSLIFPVLVTYKWDAC